MAASPLMSLVASPSLSPCSSWKQLRPAALPPSNLLSSSGAHSSCASTFFSDGRKHIAPKFFLTPRKEQHSGTLVTKAIFGLGVPELVVIAGVAALVFGPKKLPEIGKSIGKTVKSFQQAAKEFENEVKKPADLETSETSTPETPVVGLTSDAEKERAQG